jgi:diguanylate cyclase (GGDEF)-like protein
LGLDTYVLLVHASKKRVIVDNPVRNIKSNMRALFLAFILLTMTLPQTAAAIEDIPLDVSRIDVSAKRKAFNSVIASAQDSDGYIWLASMRGVNVFDGHTVRPVLKDVLQGNNPTDIHIDSNDTLWISTNSGIVAYSLKTGLHKWYRTNSDGQPLESIGFVFEDTRGTVLVASFKRQPASIAGLLRYEPSFDRFEQMNVFAPATHDEYAIYDIAEDTHRNLWLATDHGVCRLSGSQGPPTFIPLAIPQAYSAQHIAFDGAGTLWVSAESAGIWKLPSQTRNMVLQPVPDGVEGHVNNMYTDQEGDIWFSTSRGLFRYASTENRMYRHPCFFPGQESSKQNPIASVLETNSRTLWIGTYSNGVMRYVARPGARIVNLLGSEISENRQFFKIQHITVSPDSRIYFAPNTGGVYRTAPVTTNRILLSRNLEAEPLVTGLKITSMKWAPDNSLICGFWGGILRTAPNGQQERIRASLKPMGEEIEDADIEFLCPMEDGRIWFSTKFDLYSWTPGQPAAYYETRMPGSEPITNLEASGTSLLVSHGTKVSEVDTRSGRWFPVTFDPSPEANHSKVKSLKIVGESTLWIGTHENTFRYNRQTGLTTTILTSDRQRLTLAQSFSPDQAGNVWINTQEKLYRIARGSALAVEEIVAADHPSVAIHGRPAQLAGGALVYGHTEGLLLVIPQRLIARQKPFPKISEVRVFGKPLPPTPLGRMPSELVLDPEQNYLTFTFSIPEPLAMQRPRYQYFLEGVDSTWNDSGDQASISYAHLTPGRYSLHVKDRPDSQAVTSMEVTILAPWWQTPWAKAGYALAIILGGIFAIRTATRVQTSRIRKEMLENLVMQDPLTEVPNRRKFKEVLAAEKSRCKRSNHQISVLMIDIDYFKGFNDRFGHQAGDKALRVVAQTVSSTLKRPEDFVPRFGGEEFVVVLPSTNRAGAERVAQKIQDAIYTAEIPYPGSPLSDRVTLSIGISTFSPQTDLHIDSGLFSADQALYQAKRNGRNCVFYKDHCLALTPVRQ